MSFSLRFKWKKLFVVMFIFLFIACHHEKRPEQNADLGLPPDELIHSNFSAADFVLSIKPDSLKIVKTIYADNGEPGYVVVEVAGKVKESYKGGMAVGESVHYQFWSEFEENLLRNWRSKELLLVFLKKNEKSGGLRAIEFGQFELAPGLHKKVMNIRKD